MSDANPQEFLALAFEVRHGWPTDKAHDEARKLLSLMRNAGLVVVPRNPTPEMEAVEESFLCRVYNGGDIWRAMIDETLRSTLEEDGAGR